ncbi:MAG TPA: glycosyltransferase [Acidimicrobiia bacterium]|nr:glycosyltransferase [Acidimicrobiia bacterium]
MADSREPLQILVINYLCVPGRGSERGAGWGMLMALQAFGRCTVVTAPESAEAIHRWNAEHPDRRVESVTIGEPRLAPLLKRTRVGEFLIYLMWQRRVSRSFGTADRVDRFDLAWHATLSAFWLPSVATTLGIPSVWGPVGGAVATPRRLWPLLGWRGVVVEIVDLLSVRLMSLLPRTRHTWRAATVRIAQNAETVRRLPGELRDSTVVLNHALFHDITDETLPAQRAASDPYVAWVSPMDSRKGPELALRALMETSADIEMVMVGDGPELARMKELAETVGVSSRITFTGRVPHDTALGIIRDARVALFTGLREEGGLALAEAMILGTPIVVLGHGGAAGIASQATDPDRVTIVAPSTLEETISAMGAGIESQFRRSDSKDRVGRSALVDRHAADAVLEDAIVRAVGP